MHSQEAFFCFITAKSCVPLLAVCHYLIDHKKAKMQIKGIQKADQSEYKQIQFLLIGLTPASFSLSGILTVIILNISFLSTKFSQELSYLDAQ